MKDLLFAIQDFEDVKTNQLFDEFKNLSQNDFLTKQQLLKILIWKSPRPLNHYLRNTEDEVIELTKLAFSARNDSLKVHVLTAIKGVHYPAASAILMFYNPVIYPVIDIRVWRQLYFHNLVKNNPKGQNFTLEQYSKYINVIRNLAQELSLTARQVEKRIFDYDKANQVGRLYDKLTITG